VEKVKLKNSFQILFFLTQSKTTWNLKKIIYFFSRKTTNIPGLIVALFCGFSEKISKMPTRVLSGSSSIELTQKYINFIAKVAFFEKKSTVNISTRKH